MDEIYKTVEGFENYEVSNLGNIKNKRTGRILKQINDEENYLQVRLYNNKTSRTIKVHKLVAKMFLENPENKPYVDHIDNNRLNNNLINLKYTTCKENSQNVNISKTNTSSVQGVSYCNIKNKYRAIVCVDGVSIHLGYFNTLEEAKQARLNKVNEVFDGWVMKHNEKFNS
jgi:hypothetical protein